MNRSLLPMTLTAMSLAPSRSFAQTLATEIPDAAERSPSTNQVAAIVLGASLVVAALGGGYWAWKRRGLPNDGVERTPAQLRSHRELTALEKILTAEERNPRRAAVAALLNLVPSLAAADRGRALHRLAQHFCLDWKWLMDDKTVDNVMRGKVSRWPKEWRDELVAKIATRLDDGQEPIRRNAALAHKWFQHK